MSGALLSVVMPVYNGDRYLRHAVESVLSQTYTDFEFVIVNDGSTDFTLDILKSFELRDRRVRVISKTHSGLIDTLNLGCGMASGHYIARADADDVCLPRRLESQMEFLAERPGVALLGAAATCINEDGAAVGYVMRPPKNEHLKRALENRNAFHHYTVIFRKDCFLTLGGYRHAFLHAEDYDLWLRFAEQFDVANIPDVLCYYRLHRNQVSITETEQQAVSALGARVAAGFRKLGNESDFLATGTISIPHLLRFGVGRDQIEAELIAHYLDRVNFLLSLANVNESEVVLDRFIENAVALRLSRRHLCSLLRLRARLYRNGGAMLRAWLTLAKAVLCDPIRAASFVARSAGLIARE